MYDRFRKVYLAPFDTAVGEKPFSYMGNKVNGDGAKLQEHDIGLPN